MLLGGCPCHPAILAVHVGLHALQKQDTVLSHWAPIVSSTWRHPAHKRQVEPGLLPLGRPYGWPGWKFPQGGFLRRQDDPATTLKAGLHPKSTLVARLGLGVSPERNASAAMLRPKVAALSGAAQLCFGCGPTAKTCVTVEASYFWEPHFSCFINRAHGAHSWELLQR